MLITLDFETYYDREYTLRKMTPVEYILDQRFETIGCAIKEGDAKSEFLTANELQRYLLGIDANTTDVITHNALFDMCILAWRYGFVPRMMIDTLGMSRALLSPYLRSLSLEQVAKFLELPAKGDTVKQVVGMTGQMIRDAGLWDEYATYSCRDADITYEVFKRLMKRGFPKNELFIMDMVLRCAVMPSFRLDTETLYQHLAEVQQAKAALMATITADRSTLMSNDMFAQALKDLGVDPPTKVSLATGKETWAFSKTDVDFNDLQEHPDPRVQALVAARLGIKSTLEETRTQRLIAISQLEWSGMQRRFMPIPLKYSGAHTHRLCLAGNTIICVLRDNRVVYERLDHLQGTDLVWDGEVFVRHGGLAYAGLKEVIEYDGVVGTKDHRVWTVEQRYRELADAKARGTHIARGAVPDATRIDPSVQWSSDLHGQDQVQLCKVRSRSVLALEGFTRPKPHMVQILRRSGSDGGSDTFTDNAGCGHASERSHNHSATGAMASANYLSAVGKALDESTSQSAVSEVAGRRMGQGNEGGCRSTPTLFKPRSHAVPVLRWERDRVSFSIDCLHGRLATGEPRSKASQRLNRSDRLQRTLRAGKSTLGDKGRAIPQPIFVPTWDIVACGPRNRFMANGRIVHNSGDWKLNMQNLPRGGNLRKALVAPEKKVVVAVDASQIEARLVSWFAGQMDLTEAFANGEDVYSLFASDVYGFQVNKKENPVERFVGKQCLAEDTIILTDTGWKPIQYVGVHDKLWDGTQWVKHKGLIDKGMKPTQSAYGLTATGDHEILTEHGWQAWSEVLTSPSLFQSALSMASLPSQGINATSDQRAGVLGGSLLYAVHAVGSVVSSAATCFLDALRDATHAPRWQQALSVIGYTRTPCLTMSIGQDCSTDWRQQLHGATTKQTVRMSTTDSVALQSMTNGLMTGLRSFGTSKPWKAGITQSLKWIASMLTEVTCRVTSGLSASHSTWQTSGGWQTSNNASANLRRVYDIADAGPLKRFTVMTDLGPVIAHNCILGLGYGLGWKKFMRQLRVLGRNQTGQDIVITEEEARRIVGIYREKYFMIPMMWRVLNAQLPLMTREDHDSPILCVNMRHEHIMGPSGLPIRYHNLRHEEEQWKYDHSGKTKRIYGGAALENIIQYLARIHVMDAAVRVRRAVEAAGHRGIRLALQAHDELVYVVPERQAQYVHDLVLAEMSRRPEWAPNAPLAAEGGIGPTYADAK